MYPMFHSALRNSEYLTEKTKLYLSEFDPKNFECVSLCRLLFSSDSKVGLVRPEPAQWLRPLFCGCLETSSPINRYITTHPRTSDKRL
ncbi:MAG: hypothetical protein ACI92G_000920 [Candidatus Pelagisphaera sp.]|jgi:hypothetical protein